MILNDLNEAQRAAVENTEGPSMVIAGAGSGKTRVLTYRIAYLLLQKVDPFSILALTFTNKAAKEMQARIVKLVGSGEARNIWMGTFHSIFARILRIESDRIGYPPNFTIYDTDDSKSLLKTIIKEYNLDDKIYKPGVVLHRISSAKSNLISAAAYLNNVDIQAEDRQAGRPKIADIYMEYEKRCFRASAMDFDDLLYKTNVLLRDHADILHKYQHRFRYILVDEYQDTNYSQYLIVKKLAAMHENICVVGDDAQSIYAFRGANIQNILNFRKDYPDVKTFKLEQNYRSTKNIVNAANSIIAKNQDQIKKDVWTQNDAGNRVKVHKAISDNEEGSFIAGTVFEVMQQKQAHPKDFAVLYRTNAQSRAIEEALRRRNISYRIYGGLSFYQRKEIKDILAYFRLATNPADEEAFKRVVNYPARGIGKTSLERLVIASNKHDKPIWEIIGNLDGYQVPVNNSIKKKLSDFRTMIESFHVQLDKKDAYDLGSDIASASGILKDLYTDKTPEGISRYENIQELLNGLKEFSENKETEDQVRTLPEFMADVALLTDADNDDPKNNDVVSLMTIHAAKGLEFPYVFVTGLEENLFPSQMALMSRTELEEERRLFYVALTRAEQQVYLSYATSRYRWGNLIYCEPSRFLEELDEAFVEHAGAGLRSKPRGSAAREFESKGTPVKTIHNLKKKKLVKTTNPGTNAPGEIARVAVGNQVKHAKFGIGTVMEVEGDFPEQKATIQFDKNGKKQLLLKFAKLEILS